LEDYWKSGGLTMKIDELPICPFCGRKAQIESKSDWKGRNIYYVRCTTSGCPGHPIKPACFTIKANAVKAWSRRADND
jgi:hypothetical protein